MSTKHKFDSKHCTILFLSMRTTWLRSLTKHKHRSDFDKWCSFGFLLLEKMNKDSSEYLPTLFRLKNLIDQLNSSHPKG